MCCPTPQCGWQIYISIKCVSDSSLNTNTGCDRLRYPSAVSQIDTLLISNILTLFCSVVSLPLYNISCHCRPCLFSFSSCPPGAPTFPHHFSTIAGQIIFLCLSPFWIFASPVMPHLNGIACTDFLLVTKASANNPLRFALIITVYL